MRFSNRPRSEAAVASRFVPTFSGDGLVVTGMVGRVPLAVRGVNW